MMNQRRTKGEGWSTVNGLSSPSPPPPPPPRQKKNEIPPAMSLPKQHFCFWEFCWLFLLLFVALSVFPLYSRTLNGSNTADGSLTTAVSNSFLSPLERNPIAAELK